LMLLAITGLRRNEAGLITKKQIDLSVAVLHIPDTKTSHPHSLPITPMMRDILDRHTNGIGPDDLLFEGVSLEHLAQMAMRAGAPEFMLHDLRKILATVGEQLGHSNAVMRRILNHKAKRADTLHRHYISLSASDISIALKSIQEALIEMMEMSSS